MGEVKLSKGKYDTQEPESQLPGRPARRAIHCGTTTIENHHDLRRLLTLIRHLEQALEKRTRALELWLEVLDIMPVCPYKWCEGYVGAACRIL